MNTSYYCYCSCFAFSFLYSYGKMQFFIHCNFFCQKYKFTYLPDNLIICATYVVGIYPNIPHEEGLLAIRKALSLDETNLDMLRGFI